MGALDPVISKLKIEPTKNMLIPTKYQELTKDQMMTSQKNSWPVYLQSMANAA